MTPKQVKGKNWLQLYIRLVNDTNKELLRLLYNDNIVSIVDNYDNAIKKNAACNSIMHAPVDASK